MIIKHSRNNFQNKVLDKEKVSQVLADPVIVDRMTKVAQSVKNISPRSDDFLYFSIIFMKAAEASLLNENGGIKKLASGEKAWGYFDDNWRWHGNVLPHKNNNSDIFPESELKVAAKEWIGLPLCRDHESSSVDGIRGIILDTHYDEKYKQIVGLCALDRANYPDLASKVEKGLVRYGSMGTGVERSICTECGNMARTANEYCTHVANRSCHGEINVGLKPIEYSLVVQPAEPGAILLKCIASLNNYKQDFRGAGISDVEKRLESLSLSQAKHLEGIMKKACDGNSCSIDDRNKIINKFFDSIKVASADGDSDLNDSEIATGIRNLTESAEKLDRMGHKNLSKDIVNLIPNNFGIGQEYKVESDNLSFSEPDLIGGVSNAVPEDESASSMYEDFPQTDPDSITLSASQDQTVKLQTKALLEEIMKKSKLQQRSNARRKIAYMQGGSEGREPNTFKEETFSYEQDKHMKQTGSTGGADGMFPGDSEKKEKLSRAELQERVMQRMAYMQGGSEGREPNTFKQENYGYEQDKHMKQTGSTGGDSGMFPGDSEKKEKLKRASIARPLSKTSAYNGPSLSTKVKIVRTASGKISKADCVFEIYAGKERVFSDKLGRIFGTELDSNWAWATSKDYGREVCRTVRAKGLNQTIGILKNAQDAGAMPEAAEADLPDLGAEAPADMGPDMGSELEGMPEAEDADLPDTVEEEGEPAEEIDKRISQVEGLLSEISSFVDEMKSETKSDVTVTVNTGEEGEEEAGDINALAVDMIGRLKTAASELDESADEMAMVSETFENIGKISKADQRRFRKLAAEAVGDCDRVIGEAKALLSVGRNIKVAMSRNSIMKKANEHMVMDADDMAMDEVTDMVADTEEDMVMDDLISEAMNLRKERRSQILKQAEDRMRSFSKKASYREENEADDAEEHMAEDAAEDMAADTDEHMAMDSKTAGFKAALKSQFQHQKVAEERENYKIKLRRAYDVALEMQKKGLIGQTKTALDEQVDAIMGFDDNAFESFKRSIANTRNVNSVKVASDLGGVNIGLTEENDFAKRQSSRLTANLLSGMWDK